MLLDLLRDRGKLNVETALETRNDKLCTPNPVEKKNMHHKFVVETLALDQGIMVFYTLQRYSLPSDAPALSNAVKGRHDRAMWNRVVQRP
ncbi:hypothetical protein M404DRAFT_398267 [Pisolithus tinctorius Marx 270]|uniref:Uncharacterized protein n=1 Tax=Pisolithus tinctorius Marx 270 TaxID=870435 RepID=A0A0C3KE22_PISTI|nr:hypothetical protein M404DRAFT_398267 [Pisolithus tinctorius Marx 270]